MNPLTQYNIEYFNNARISFGTITCWFFVPLDDLWLSEIAVSELSAIACMQLASEEQACAADDVIAYDDLNSKLSMFAPVQLYDNLSPLPFLGQLLDAPQLLKVEEGTFKVILANWKFQHGLDRVIADSNEFPLTTAIVRHACQHFRSLAVLVFGGHSIKDNDLNEQNRMAMKAAGFSFFERSEAQSNRVR